MTRKSCCSGLRAIVRYPTRLDGGWWGLPRRRTTSSWCRPSARSKRMAEVLMDEAKQLDAAWVAEIFASLRAAIGTVVMGNDEAIRLSFVTLLCSGHSLYEGVPGLAKTLLVRTLAATLGIRFGRIQCTPDLMPSDIIGTPILHQEKGEFRFRPGPLFTDLLLVDEIN